MRNSFSKLLLTASALFLLVGTAHAEDKPAAPVAVQAIAAPPPPPPVNPQQERMKSCNSQASGKKGNERKVFMKACLAGEDTAKGTAKKVTPQERMKVCNAEAKDKKLAGQERKDFMKTCLKAK